VITIFDLVFDEVIIKEFVQPKLSLNNRVLSEKREAGAGGRSAGRHFKA
jgi:hypothetical protein